LRGASSSRTPELVPHKSTSTPITSTITFSGGLTQGRRSVLLGP
jgi:hypothetical protein